MEWEIVLFVFFIEIERPLIGKKRASKWLLETEVEFLPGISDPAGVGQIPLWGKCRLSIPFI